MKGTMDRIKAFYRKTFSEVFSEYSSFLFIIIIVSVANGLITFGIKMLANGAKTYLPSISPTVIISSLEFVDSFISLAISLGTFYAIYEWKKSKLKYSNLFSLLINFSILSRMIYFVVGTSIISVILNSLFPLESISVTSISMALALGLGESLYYCVGMLMLANGTAFWNSLLFFINYLKRDYKFVITLIFSLLLVLVACLIPLILLGQSEQMKNYVVIFQGIMFLLMVPILVYMPYAFYCEMMLKAPNEVSN